MWSPSVGLSISPSICATYFLQKGAMWEKDNVQQYFSWGSKTVKIADLFLLKHLALHIDMKKLENCSAETHSSASPTMEGLEGQGLGGRPLFYNSRKARNE